MSAYSRDGLSVEAYLARLLTAIIRQNGGELRIKGEIVDMVGEPTAFIKEWDKEKQEVVLRCGVGSFVETFRVVPEKPTGPQTQIPAAAPANGHAVDPLAGFFREAAPATDPVDKSRSVSTLEGERLVELENKLKKIRLKRMFQEEIEANQRKAARQERTTP
jgi:hypothetical protein